jgi:hypothetical protein
MPPTSVLNPSIEYNNNNNNKLLLDVNNRNKKIKVDTIESLKIRLPSIFKGDRTRLNEFIL